MKKTLKKIASAVVASAMALSLAACGGVASGTPDVSSIELTRLMGNGINLGNTMEATGRTFDTPAKDVVSCETAWDAPVTTQEMITGMKEAGFDTLRIPTGWANMMDYTNGDYTIPDVYLDRVEEIVNYALNEDMYVIVNDHWDNQWWGMFGDADEAVRDEAWKMYESIWTQVADRFKSYDNRLIFESANEELGNRLNDDWHLGPKQTGVLSEDECYETANKINQKFVDIVRKSGKNNKNRFLLIAGYGTEISKTLDDRFVMPTDTATDKLLVSVHFYDPSDYCLWDISYWGTKDEYAAVNDTLATLTKFTDAGIGVIIGEYGALPDYDNGNNTLKENAALYNKHVLDVCDYYGYCPVLWDTNAEFNRAQCKLKDADMAEVYASRNAESEKGVDLETIKANAKAEMDKDYENASEGYKLDSNTAMAWIMYTSYDWTTQYIVGDVYDPTGTSNKIKATDVEITGPGTYTVALDFTGVNGGYANSTAFSAIGIANGEDLFPGYIINIKEILINGEKYQMNGRPYTSSDDQHCTRVNLFNEWVPAPPDDARTMDGGLSGCTPCVLDKETLGNVKTIEITFDYVAPKN